MHKYRTIIVLVFTMLIGSGAAVLAADYDKGYRAWQAGDFDAALAEWVPLAEQGLVEAQFALGTIYDNGEGVPENDKTAAEWYTKAAEQGHAKAQFALGLRYSRGEGVVENDKTAGKWFTKAAEQGLAEAQFNLGLRYSRGEGVVENDKTAVKWITKAAEQGLAEAQYNLGVKYEFGEGVLTDDVRAYMWYNLAAYNGNRRGAAYKKGISDKMTSTQIAKAQEMSSRCLERNYKDC